jgi:hypothetical protein
MKSDYSSPIQRIGDALVAEGFVTLCEQAKALGLPRSTTWTILRANHKKSGLSAAIVNRILKAPQLPGSVRAKVLQYVEEKSAGLHGHNKLQQRRFAARLESMRRRGLDERDRSTA